LKLIPTSKQTAYINIRDAEMLHTHAPQEHSNVPVVNGCGLWSRRQLMDFQREQWR